jgi:hypothetical protein
MVMPDNLLAFYATSKLSKQCINTHNVDGAASSDQIAIETVAQEINVS